MTESGDQIATQAERPPLGIIDLIGATFRSFFARFGLIFALAYLAALAVLAINSLLIGPLALGALDPDASEQAVLELFSTADGMARFFAVSLITPAIGFSLSNALIALAAYDAQAGRPARLGRYLATALSHLPAIIVLSLVVSVLGWIGFAALIAPGLWIFAVFAVTAPAIVIERAGFGALGRSAALTRGYRWPIVGAILLLGLIALALNAAFEFGLSPLLLEIGEPWLIAAIAAATAALTLGVSGAFVATLYARLREIRDGATPEALAAVFD